MAKSQALTVKANPLVTVLQMAWGVLKFLLIPSAVMLAALEIFTPSLRFDASSAQQTFVDETPSEWATITSSSGQTWSAMRTSVLTHDYRYLKIDYIAPQNGLNSAPIPLTIIVAGFTPPEWLIDRVRPRGFNAVVIYRSPRAARMTGPYLPTARQFRDARKLSDFWNLAATNPLNRLYSVHAALHEAPGDIADIVTWAKGNIRADTSRINIIGLGTGALIAAAAADKLQAIGMPARTLSLIYPPALLGDAIQDNLLGLPDWLRSGTAALLGNLYFRLDLQRHLPRIGEQTAKLVVIPRNSFDLATYAAEPAITLAGANTESKYVDVNYTGYYDDANAARIHNIVGDWLVAQGAVTSY